MNIKELRHGHTSKVKLLPIDHATFKIAPSINQEIFLKNTDENELLVAWEGIDYPLYAKVESHSDHDAILYNLNRGNPVLGNVIAVQSGDNIHEFWVEIYFLNGAPSSSDMAIGIDEKIIDQLVEKFNKPSLTLTEAIDYLSEDFVLKQIQNVPESISNIKGDRWIVVPSKQAEELTFNRFRILGAKHAVDVVRSGEGQNLFVERLIWKQKIVTGNSWEPLWLLHGELSFVDATVAAQIQSGNIETLDSIVKSASSYLNLWQRFQDLEVKKTSDSGRDLGTFPYCECKRNHEEDAWEFKLDVDFEQMNRLDGKVSEMGGESIFEAAKGHINWDRMFLQKGQDKMNERNKFAGRCIKINPRTKTIFLQSSEYQRNKPPKEGSIYLSMVGDKVRLNRRQEAINKILQNDQGVSTLAHLIEGHSVPSRRIRSEASMSKTAKECFHGDPTENQKKAVDLALNTPDIAIIQGPPGTGKTRTIAAIVQRLNELSKKDKIQGSPYLLTSFQHDAVETVAQATQLMGLPAIKYGKKHDQSDQSTNSHIQHWISELTQKIEDDLASSGPRPLSRILNEIKARRLAYLQSPGTIEHTSQLLKNIADLIEGVLADDLRQRCLDESRNLTNQSPASSFDAEHVRKAILGLRTCPISFSDDGPRSANRLLSLQDELSLSDSDSSLLCDASRWDESSEETPTFIDELSFLQERLLDEISEVGTTSQVVLVHASVAKVLEDIEEAIEDVIESSPDEGPAAAFEDFIDRLREEPESGLDAIARYSRLIAATCQGSSSKRVIDLLDQGQPMFDTVIIDEAARANPLDLLIPMSLARKRIILVGDHRQLPHLLEPDVEKDLSSSVNEETETMIRESLFQRLFETTQSLQRESGIQRSVTLDRQFRMHPDLANLVSSSFYAPHDEPYESPSSESFYNAFDHQLPGDLSEKRVVWRSIPNLMGSEKKPAGGFSWAREIEAEYVAKEAKQILDSAPWLSVGIITFYSAQVSEIYRALQKEDVAERHEEGNSITVTPNYNKFPPGQKNKHGDTERLRVGTVDAFQGKEFDVVILSPVRSNTLKISSEGPRESLIRRKYGHLLLPNRLCVAMSRQRSLLVVVGDDEMFTSEAAGNSNGHPVSGIPKFLTMCRTPIGLYSSI